MVKAVGSVREALDCAKIEAPDVIVADWLMPGRDGTELLDELARIESLKRVPVIFLTARSSPGELEHLRRIGAAGVIAKPFDPLKLAGEVRRILGSIPAQGA